MTKFIAYIFLFVIIATSAAPYDFSTRNADVSAQFIIDIQSNRVDMSSLTIQAQQSLMQSLQNNFSNYVLFSRMTKICPTFAVPNQYGKQFVFRSIHTNGKIDWVVTTPDNDENLITNLVFFALPQSRRGAPAILPYAPDMNSLTPATQFGCMDQGERKLALRRAREACQQFPQFCPYTMPRREDDQ